MKKVFLLLMVAIATRAAAQSWDYLKKDFKLNKKEVVLVNDSIKTPIYSSKPTTTYDMYIGKYIKKRLKHMSINLK